jgi:hypothetical protein
MAISVGKAIGIAAGVAAAVVIALAVSAYNYGKADSTNPLAARKSSGARDLQQLNFEFTASRAFVVFPAYLPGGSIGLVVLHRATGKSRLIAQYRTQLVVPRFSSDGERLLFVRLTDRDETRELLTCRVADWQCRVLWRTTEAISSLVEIEKDVVLLASSPRTERPDARNRYPFNDLHLIRARSEPIKLSEFKFYSFNSIDVMGDKIIFSAWGAKSEKRHLFPVPPPSGLARSEIFMLKFDRSKPELENPANALQPQYLLESGYSTHLSASFDARLVAFLNRGPTAAGPEGFHLVIADRDGAIRKRVLTNGLGFSQPAFSDHTVLAKEMTRSAFVIRVFDVDANTETTIAKFDLSTDFSKLESIAITVQD